MRFLANGPALPADLVARRDSGDVLFFCGAGVSMPAGLPSFAELTSRVLDELRADDRTLLASGLSFDAVFGKLIGTYGRAAVEAAMFNALTPRADALVRSHRTLLDLSRDASARCRLVTTNFDSLFERADRKVKPIVAPFLPDLALGDYEGVVYLHGRLRAPEPGVSANYVISSQDFGRAYLAEGWATRFMRQLRRRFTLVFVGYTADDPPMRYLLEGMHAADGAGLPRPYAFTHDPASIGAWEDKGVAPILYDPADGHRALWDTLSTWATAARDPAKWRRRLIGLAQRRPALLEAHERGQVASLVASVDGAAAFAAASPPPPAEWLCVLDAGVRRGRKFRPSLIGEDRHVEIDPLDVYGLDEEPPRVEGRQLGPDDPSGEDLLGWRVGDAHGSARQRLTPWSERYQAGLTARLHHLSRWIASVLDQPCAAWWAAGAGRPHPHLAGLLRDALDRRADLRAETRLFWRCWMEAADHGWHDEADGRWYKFERRVATDGWTTAALREFSRVMRPHFAFNRGIFGLTPPPVGKWNDDTRAFHIDVKFAAPPGELAVPDHAVADVVRIGRAALQRAAEMEQEIGDRYSRAPSLHPEQADQLLLEDAACFHWFAAQFRRLAKIDPDAAHREWLAWPEADTRFFGKLVTWGAMLPAVASGEAAVSRLQALPDDVFWGASDARELLFTLRARWADFSVEDCARIEQRIRRGRPRWRRESAAEHRKWRAADAASKLRWMQAQGLALTPETLAALPRLQATNPDWRPEWVENAAMSYDGRGGVVSVDTDTKGLERLSPGAVVGMATQLAGRHLRELREDKPFQGLVEQHPFKALAALRNRLRAGEAPRELWETLLWQWPAEQRPRLVRLLAETLARLSNEALRDLGTSAARWLRGHLPVVAKLDQAAALRVFDAVLAAFATAPPGVLDSGIGDTTIGGKVQPRSRVSVEKAINSPAGVMAETLVETLGKAAAVGSPPDWFAERVDALLALPGDGPGHAMAVLMRWTSWFHHWFPQWAEMRLLSLFEPSHTLSEAAWHGFLRGGEGLPDSTWAKLKPALVRVLTGTCGWALNPNERRNAIFHFTALCLDLDGDALFTPTEARDVLRQVGDDDRVHALTALRMRLDRGAGHWPAIASFLDRAWPRELALRTADATVRALVDLASSAGLHFPEAARFVRPLLRPMQQPDMLFYRWSRGTAEGPALAERFPAATLDLADALVRKGGSAPYSLAEFLETIGAADPTLKRSQAWRALNELVRRNG